VTGPRLRLHTDGGSRGNPGLAGIGVVITDERGQVLQRISTFIGRATNNVAEYAALIEGLETALAYEPAAVTIFMDSELVVRQINGQYRVRKPDLQPLHRRAMRLLARIPETAVQHVPRERNQGADRLANEAMDKKS
jgi:ribonuclease HI